MVYKDCLKGNVKLWLCREREKILNEQIPGSSDITTREIICDDKLFIPIPWSRIPQKEEKNNKDLVAQIIDTVLPNKENLVLLGNPGQGKTTILKKVFIKLIDKYISDKINRIPVYISFHDLPELGKYGVNDIRFFQKFFDLRDYDFPFSYNNIKSLSSNKDIIYLLDGLDEITTELNQTSINKNLKSIIFNYFSILTCRSEFYDTFLSESEIKRRYKNKIYISELKYNKLLKKYISNFCEKKEFPYKNIYDLLDNNPNIKELIICPLWLMMFLDIFTDWNYFGRANNLKTWGIAELYGVYIEKWLKNEAAKKDSFLNWRKKNIRMKKLSWYMYDKKESNLLAYGSYQSSYIKRGHIFEALKDSNGNLDDKIINDISSHTLLTRGRDKKKKDNLSSDNYYFIHYSFQEYYTALCIFEKMKSDYESTKDAIKRLIPFEIAKFLKDMLDNNSSKNDKERITNNLQEIYQNCGGVEKLNLILRQHASYYLAFLKTRDATNFLLEGYDKEKNKWVKRSMIVGLANFCNRSDIMKKYIKMLYEDKETSKINLAFHLVYYGDLPLEKMFGSKEAEVKDCSRTIRAIIGHLKNKKYKNSWVLDMFTLNNLLQFNSGRKSIFDNNEHIKILKIFLQKKRNLKNNELLLREIKLIKGILGEEINL